MRAASAARCRAWTVAGTAVTPTPPVRSTETVVTGRTGGVVVGATVERGSRLHATAAEQKDQDRGDGLWRPLG